MRFVKLDTKLLTSSLWVDREGREVFITALLMANPCELHAPEPQLAVRELTETGFIISPGRYGFIAAAGSGIVRQAGVSLKKAWTRLNGWAVRILTVVQRTTRGAGWCELTAVISFLTT